MPTYASFDESSITNPFLRTLIHGDKFVGGPITYYFSDAVGVTDAYGNLTVGGWAANGLDVAFRYATAQWAAVANVTFQEASSPAASPTWTEYLTRGADYAGYHYYPNTSGQGGAFDLDEVNLATSLPGGYGLYAMLHEIGHGLGLSHTFDTGPDGPFPGAYSPWVEGDNSLSTGFYSVMAYVTQPYQNSSFSDNYGAAATPMAFDIAAIQALYGANMSTATGNDVYVLPTDGGVQAWACIWDVSGNDTIDGSLCQGSVTLDLRAATLLNEVGGGGFLNYQDGWNGGNQIYGGFTIANGVVIENATGGVFGDLLTGNDASNTLDGGGGNDVIRGGYGDDLLIGGAGRDRAMYTGVAAVVDLAITTAQATGHGNDTLSGIEDLTGSDFDDTLSGNSTANDLNGGNGVDTLSGRGGNDSLVGGGGGDVISGGAGSDSIYGDDGNDFLYGDAGNDTFYEGSGNDYIKGGDGQDTVAFVWSGTGIVIDLNLTGQQNTNVGYDSYVSVENVIGSSYTDSIFGNDQANVIDGGDGRDTLDGGLGNDRLSGGDDDDIVVGGNGDDWLSGGLGNDLLVGGNGTDTASFAYSFWGVVVTLVGNDDYDSLVGIENLSGSSYGDELTGDGGANVLWGAAGQDTLSGGDGDDRLLGGDDDDALFGGAGADYLAGGAGADKMNGGAGDDVYVIRSVDDIVVESLDGGIDTIIADGASIVMADNVENATILRGTYRATGNALANTITGSGLGNILYGADGSDTLRGMFGDDTLRGGGGRDWLYGGNGHDTLTGGYQGDYFAFAALGESPVGETNADRITDFRQSDGDVIVLSDLDAIASTGANDAFTFIGSANFHHVAGELRYRFDGTGSTIVQMDVNGDGFSDCTIFLTGEVTLTTNDFIL